MARKLTRAQQQERADAAAELRQYLKPGDTVWSIVRSVARSGMSRDISLLVFIKRHGEREATPIYLSRLVALACGFQMTNTDRAAIKRHGCGMDMVWDTIDTLSHVLGPEYRGKLRAEQL